MMLANALFRRRRQLAFGALTVLLHLLVFDWFSGQLGRRREEAARVAPAPIAAQLIRTKLPVPAMPAPAPTLRLDPPPLPDLAPEPVEVADAGPGTAPDAPPNAGPGQSRDGDAGAMPAAGQQRATPVTADVQSQPAQATAAQPVPVAEQRRYKIALPPQADITLDVARIDANGTHWNGEALLTWRRSGPAYQVRVEAGIRVMFARVELLTLTSEGTLGDEGFVPMLMTEKRRGRAMTATHFNRQDGSVTFSASQARVALLPGTQDKGSLPLQLAAIGRGDPKQMAGNIDILVGEERGANVFSFTVAGQEQIDTRLGKIATWHLVRPPRPGSYHSRLEVWLAPDHGWLPVQMRSVEANGAITTQTASNIVIKETGSQ